MFRICSFFLFLAALADGLAAEPADFIWSARYVITMDAQRRVIEHGAIAIKGERILAIGTPEEIKKIQDPLIQEFLHANFQKEALKSGLHLKK